MKEKKLFAIIGILVLALFITPILGTMIGMFSGWIVGLFFGETILKFFTQIGISNMTCAQIGASLGFIGGFFRINTKDKK